VFGLCAQTKVRAGTLSVRHVYTLRSAFEKWSIVCWIMKDRRFEPRRAARERVELSWTDQKSADQALSGILRDVSKSGASVRTDHPVRINTKMRLAIRGTVVTATVKSCVRVGPQCQLGLEFDPEFHGAVDVNKSLG
jgi:hypothetical protein